MIKLLNAEEVAQALSLSKRQAQRLIQQGVIPGFKESGRWLVKEEDFDEYVERKLEEAEHLRLQEKLNESSTDSETKPTKSKTKSRGKAEESANSL